MVSAARLVVVLGGNNRLIFVRSKSFLDAEWLQFNLGESATKAFDPMLYSIVLYDRILYYKIFY